MIVINHKTGRKYETGVSYPVDGCPAAGDFTPHSFEILPKSKAVVAKGTHALLNGTHMRLVAFITDGYEVLDAN